MRQHFAAFGEPCSTPEEVHAAVRRVAVAAADHRTWETRYKESPDDYAAAGFHASWKELRGAVDALVALPLMWDYADSLPPATRPEGS